MADTVYDIVEPVLRELVEVEEGDKMDLDHGDDERTEKEL
jgi:hypothetical protein